MYYFILIIHPGYFFCKNTVLIWSISAIKNLPKWIRKIRKASKYFFGKNSSGMHCMISHVRGTKCLMKINADWPEGGPGHSHALYPNSQPNQFRLSARPRNIIVTGCSDGCSVVSTCKIVCKLYIAHCKLAHMKFYVIWCSTM